MRQENAENTAETFTAGNYAEITTRGWGQHQTFVRRRTARRLYTPCLTLFPNGKAHHHSYIFQTRQQILPMFSPLTFRLMMPCPSMRTRPRFSHIHQSITNIRPTCHAHAAKQDEHLPTQAHGAWNRRKRIQYEPPPLPFAGLRMRDTTTARFAGRFQWWKARWATTTPLSLHSLQLQRAYFTRSLLTLRL